MTIRYRASLILIIIALLASFRISGVSLVSAQSSTPCGSNWFAQFYNNTSFTPPVAASTQYLSLNLNWLGQPTDGNGVTLTGVQADNFSVTFTSSVSLPAGTVGFTAVIDDQVTVLVGGTQVYQATVPGTYSFSAIIPAAGNYVVEVRMVEITSTAIIQLFCSQAGTTPPGTPGVPTATPGPTGPIANVVNVNGLALRTGPYLGASMVGIIRPNVAYSVTARNVDEGGGYTWYRLVDGDRVGWSSGRYLTLNVDPNTIPMTGTVFEQIDGAPDVGVTAVPRAIMNLRRRPSQRSARIGQVGWGEECSLIGRTIQGGLNFWFQVRCEGRPVGWIYAPFVGWRGPIDAVPIR